MIKNQSWEEISFPIDSSLARSIPDQVWGLGAVFQTNPDDPGAGLATDAAGEPLMWIVDALAHEEAPILGQTAPPDTSWVEGKGLEVRLNL
ncbi:MAG: hypothetical protein ACE5HI_16695 [bacterium]